MTGSEIGVNTPTRSGLRCVVLLSGGALSPLHVSRGDDTCPRIPSAVKATPKVESEFNEPSKMIAWRGANLPESCWTERVAPGQRAHRARASDAAILFFDLSETCLITEVIGRIVFMAVLLARSPIMDG
jgi:hypothetical protein